MAIAIFGGSFDPPHLGHVAVVRRALETLAIERLYVVPAFVNPFKQGTHAPAAMRLKWLVQIFEGQARVEVSRFEAEAGKAVTTIETVTHFQQVDPDIYVIIGADNLSSLHRWHRFDALDRLVTWVVATRDGRRAPAGMRTLDVDVPVSSTLLRTGQKTDMIPDAVREEIKDYYKDTNAETTRKNH